MDLAVLRRDHHVRVKSSQSCTSWPDMTPSYLVQRHFVYPEVLLLTRVTIEVSAAPHSF